MTMNDFKKEIPVYQFWLGLIILFGGGAVAYGQSKAEFKSLEKRMDETVVRHSSDEAKTILILERIDEKLDLVNARVSNIEGKLSK
jgi:hypothetical protein